MPATESRTAAILAIAGSMASQYAGAALAKGLFPQVGAAGVTTLRVVLAAVLLTLFWRPWRARPAKTMVPALIAYGLLLGVMNSLIYQAFARIPIGLAVATEAVGPLCVVLIASRRPGDLVWLALAAGGLLLLAPLDQARTGLDPLGVILALGAAACWAGYILAGKRVASLGPAATAWGMMIAIPVVLPLGLAHSGAHLLSPRILALGLCVAALSSALPYSLEMAALRRLPSGLFGLLASASPAAAAVAGFAFLRERLDPPQILAIACIIAACAGSAISSRNEAAESLPG